MNLPVKANPMVPEVVFPKLNSLPAMFQNALPPTVPQAQYKAGIVPIVSNFIHNIKLEQMEKSANLEANIAEHHVRKLRANLDGIKELILFGQKYELEVKSLHSAIRLIDINEQKAQAEMVNLQLKNVNEQNEVKMSFLDLKMRLNEAKEIGVIDEDWINNFLK